MNWSFDYKYDYALFWIVLNLQLYERGDFKTYACVPGVANPAQPMDLSKTEENPDITSNCSPHNKLPCKCQPQPLGFRVWCHFLKYFIHKHDRRTYFIQQHTSKFIVQ